MKKLPGKLPFHQRYYFRLRDEAPKREILVTTIVMGMLFGKVTYEQVKSFFKEPPILDMCTCCTNGDDYNEDEDCED